jgi:large subunit ribosomal protein L18
MKRKIRNEKRKKWEARRGRVLRGLSETSRIRLTVFRSARHIYAQLDDLATGQSLGTVSTLSSSLRSGKASSGKVDAARQVGKAVAELAREKGIQKVVFNRNGFLYHGRVKALAQGAREGGLEF